MGWCFLPRSSIRFFSLNLLLGWIFFLDLSPRGESFTTIARVADAPIYNTVSAPFWRLFLAKDDPSGVVFTDRLRSKSGLPVCKYALGGAARSTQPTSLVYDYCDSVVNWFEEQEGEPAKMAPFFFYYNPHRYPDFMRGIRHVAEGTAGKTKVQREDLFLVSGGTDYSEGAMERRLNDALAYSGGDYLDMFVLEYVCPYDIEDDPQDIKDAIAQARSWVNDGRVRYVAASTHSHRVGAWLGSLVSEESSKPLLDAMMLRYNMAHKSAAERISFPVCSDAEIPVMAFTTTRWNRLQAGHSDWKNDPPTSSECISFALSSHSNESPEPWPVQVVLHSARTTEELKEAMGCLSQPFPMTEKEKSQWKNYGDLEWNDMDGFDEYPEEKKE